MVSAILFCNSAYKSYRRTNSIEKTPSFLTTSHFWCQKRIKCNGWIRIVSEVAWSLFYRPVVLNNNDIIVIDYYKIFRSKDGGFNWHETPSVRNNWDFRYFFQAVVTKDNNILVMGGNSSSFVRESIFYNDIWLLSMNNKNY